MLLSEARVLYLEYIDDPEGNTVTSTQQDRHLQRGFHAVYNRLVRSYPQLVEQRAEVSTSGGAFDLSTISALEVLAVQITSSYTPIYKVKGEFQLNTSSLALTLRYIPTSTFPAAEDDAFDFNLANDMLQEDLGEAVALEAATIAVIRDGQIPPAILARKDEIYRSINGNYSYTHFNGVGPYDRRGLQPLRNLGYVVTGAAGAGTLQLVNL